ncbi:GlsB/YeaQ/YmgE family stress response membrane protein [Altericroceibacterium spongiae]|uniref:GlsB/YeaQ/YmgE family stress response membrane protein n=1 Tax=Altericroceibacterium spongiae TaxID=2320269 RepID=A0A420EPD5_9SPHN|nr:GlsB/YeaQ/YmgE family stress response membrane protein [Altericroceibacterium spongiae]RKF22539.1 GlsB/YeaQ/YmgE family stress response membrane protein [Altericroceibacterium spongiae]
MGVVFLIVVGAIFGWLASIWVRAESSSAILLNMGIGIVGALLADIFISPLLSNSSIFGGTNSVGTLLVSLLGSVALLVAFNFIRNRQLR